MSRFLPSMTGVASALVLLLPVGTFTVRSGALLGAFAGYGVALGVLPGAVAASLALSTSMRLLPGMLTGAAAVTGQVAVDKPALIVGRVVIASLAQAPANQVSSGVAVMLPALVIMNARA